MKKLSPMKLAARKSADALLKAAVKKRRWTPEESRAWTRAFNALKRLGA